MKILIVCDGPLPPAACSVQDRFKDDGSVVKTGVLGQYDIADYDFVIVVDNIFVVRTARNKKKRGALVVAITNDSGLAYSAGANAVFRQNQGPELLRWLSNR